MDTPGLQTGYLRGSDVKGVKPTPEGAGAAPALVVCLQQGDGQTGTGEKSGCRQASDASPHDHHVPSCFHAGMLARPDIGCDMASIAAPALKSWLETELGVQLQALKPLGGGCTHRSWCLQLTSGARLFAKTNHHADLPQLEAEVTGLQALARWAEPPLVVPEPLACGIADEEAVLVLSWLELHSGSGGAAVGWRQLGRSLAKLHRASLGGHQGRGYGFDADNFIGAAPQCNRWNNDWGIFFRDCRLGPQFARAAQAGHRFEGARPLMDQLPRWLNDHGCEPVLVHGDLWAGNADLLEGGGVTLFDPSSHWADREVDLAMARLFGGFPAPFFDGYEEEWPLPAGAVRRSSLYNLYHLLNHANLFGGGYWQQVVESLKTLNSWGLFRVRGS